MGVARVTLAGWIAATLLAGLAGAILAPPVAAAVAAVAALGLALARRAPVAGAALVAVAAAPLWLEGAGLAGSLGPAPRPAGWPGGGVLCLAVLLAAGSQGALPRAVRWGLVALGLVLGLRAMGVAPVVAAPVGLGPGLVMGAALVAGCAAVPARGLALAGGSVLAVAVLAGGRGWSSWSQPPDTAGQVRAAAALGVLDRHQAALGEAPALGLAGIAAQPTLHPLALALVEQVGHEVVLDAGWQPEGAPLPAGQAVAVGLSLDRRGRGGEALRLLWRRRFRGPEVAWTGALLARDQGELARAEALLDRAQPSPEVPRLPGRIALDWALLSPGEHVLDLHLDEPLPGLVLHTRGESYQGPPVLWVRVDAGPAAPLEVPDGPASLALPGPFADGPHRLRVRFDNDLVGPGGDRNAWVDALGGP